MECALLNKEETTLSLFGRESCIVDIGQFGRFPLYQYKDLPLSSFDKVTETLVLRYFLTP